jgi:predicted RNase H-like HicB family nuclease
MRFACTITRLPDGRWLARHAGPEVGEVESRGATRAEAIDKLEGEIRYRLELCPCTGETYQHIAVDVVESA